MLLMRYLLFFLFCLVHIRANSQQDKRRSFSVEFSLGISGSSLYNAEAPHPFFVNYTRYGSKTTMPEYYEYDMKFFDGAVWKFFPQALVSWGHAERIRFFAGLAYKEKGINFHREKYEARELPGYLDASYSDTARRKINNRYVEMPMGVRYYFKSKKMRPYVFGGVYAALLVDEKTTFYGSKFWVGRAIPPSRELYNYAISNWREQTGNGVNGTHKIDIGLLGGGGIDVPLTKSLQLTFRTGIQMGLRRLDRYNNNEYREEMTILGPAHHSKNYYGFSSKSRHLGVEAVLGIQYLVR